MAEIKPENDLETIETHEKALDDLVSVNSLFTIAVFVGLASATPGQRSLANRPECDADMGLAKRLVVFEVISFSCFLLSSLVAKTLKMHLNVFKKHEYSTKRRFFRGGMLYLSMAGSGLGCFFLTLSMVDFIQIRLGKLSCGSFYTVCAAGSLIGIVSLALILYIPLMMHAIYVSMNKVQNCCAKSSKETAGCMWKWH